jgi:RNA polymerase sigma-70 factor (ECF subfamily)
VKDQGIDDEDTPAVAAWVELYSLHVDFVCRSLRRMGVPESSMEDGVQDVFLVVHRRLADFKGRSQIRTWLFGIVLRVARSYRRTLRRRDAHLDDTPPTDIDEAQSTEVDGPLELAVRREAADLLYRLLAEVEVRKRAMLVLVELEQMSVREAAEALAINLNTAHSRLRAARVALEQAAARNR